MKPFAVFVTRHHASIFRRAACRETRMRLRIPEPSRSRTVLMNGSSPEIQKISDYISGAS